MKKFGAIRTAIAALTLTAIAACLGCKTHLA